MVKYTETYNRSTHKGIFYNACCVQVCRQGGAAFSLPANKAALKGGKIAYNS